MIQKRRNGIIDIFRLVAVLVLMDNHLGMAGAASFFVTPCIMVDFFFYLTGYLTYRHFDLERDKYVNASAEDKSKEALFYSLNKFKGFMPLVFIVVVAQYIMTYMVFRGDLSGFREKLSIFNEMPNEILLLKSSYGSTLVGPLWYLSSMFIVLPILCLFIKFLDRYAFLIIGGMTSLLYLGKCGIDDYFYYPNCLPRAFWGMVIGASIYLIGDIWMNKLYEKINIVLLAGIEILLMVLSVVLCRDGWDYINYIHLWSIILIVSIGMSPRLSGIGSSVTTFLGKMSLPIFLMHWFIVTGIGYYFTAWSENIKKIVFYAASLGLGVLYVLISNILSKRKAS